MTLPTDGRSSLSMPSKERKQKEATSLEELARERKALALMDKGHGLNHKQAETLFQQFQRDLSHAEVVTGWAGKVQ